MIDFSFYRELFNLKSTRHSLNMGVLCIFMFIFLTSINLLSIKTNRLFDVSKDSLSTLTPVTENVLKQIDEKIEVKVFYTGNRRVARRIETILKLYQQSQGLIRIDYVNAFSQPKTAERYVKKAATSSSQGFMVFIDYKGKTVHVEAPYHEESFTTAFMKLLNSKRTQVYLTYGHGERQVKRSRTGRDLSLLKKVLESFSFQVEELLLFNNTEIPKKSLLFVAGPTKDFSEKELKLLKEFLDKGGSVFLALEPSVKIKNLQKFLKIFGLTFENNFVLDRSSGLEDGLLATTDYNDSHEVTKGFKGGRKITIFPTVGSFTSKEKKEYKVSILVFSSPHSFAIKEFKSQKISVKPQAYPLVLEVKKYGSETFKFIVSGDIDFLSSNYLETYFNKDLAINIFNYLTDRKNLVSIPRKQLKTSNIILTSVRKATLALTVFIVPLILFSLSFLFWLRGRKS